MKSFLVITIFLLRLSTISVFSYNLDGGFDGEVFDYTIDGDSYRSTSYFVFRNDNYNFFHSLNSKKYFDISIPKQFVDQDRCVYIEEGLWDIEFSEGLSYLILSSFSSFNFFERLGILYNPRRLLLYSGDNLVFASNDGLRFDGTGPFLTNTKSSSHLIEGDVEYIGNHFSFLENGILRFNIKLRPGSGTLINL